MRKIKSTTLGRVPPEAFKKLVEAGLVPARVRRFVIDSGPPDGVAKIYYNTFPTSEEFEALIDVLLSSQSRNE